jgi:hypothetical protein
VLPCLSERRRRLAVLVKEADHLATGVGSSWLSERSRRIPARPRMASSVKHPLLQNRLPALIGLNAASVADPTWPLAAADGGPEDRRTPQPGNDLIAVDRIDDWIAVTVEHNRRNGAIALAALT